MALSPSIPTSFVPKQPVPTGNRKYSSGNNIFLIVSLIVFALSVLLAIAVFLYSTYLAQIENQKAVAIAAAQKSADPATVQQFVELRNRLTATKTILDQHIELSQFFTLLENITYQDVEFSSLKIEVADDNSATVTIVGIAESFNALANESSAFASQSAIKDAIFSNITTNKDGSVGFDLTANLDPSIVQEAAAPTSPVLLPSLPASTTPILNPVTPAQSTSTPPAPSDSSSTSPVDVAPTTAVTPTS